MPRQEITLDADELGIMEKASGGFGPFDVQLLGSPQRYHAAERLAAHGWIIVYNDLKVSITPAGRLALQQHHNCMKQISKAEAENKKADRRKFFVKFFVKLAFVLLSVIGAIIAALIPILFH